MNNIFIENINKIKLIIKKRLKIFIYLSIILFIALTFLTILFSSYFFYYLSGYLVELFCISMIFYLKYFIKKLNYLLENYLDNKQDVIDFLRSTLVYIKYNQNNFLIRRFYKNIIEYYDKALKSLENINNKV